MLRLCTPFLALRVTAYPCRLKLPTLGRRPSVGLRRPLFPRRRRRPQRSISNRHTAAGSQAGILRTGEFWTFPERGSTWSNGIYSACARRTTVRRSRWHLSHLGASQCSQCLQSLGIYSACARRTTVRRSRWHLSHLGASQCSQCLQSLVRADCGPPGTARAG